MPPSIYVFTMDCLRKSITGASTTPFISSLPVQWSNCYSSSTWTLPSHASLFSGVNAMEHGVTRPRDTLSEEESVLPREAQNQGYQTAIFSENPYFSSRKGFDRNIDAVDDGIGWKLLYSTFNPAIHVEGVSTEALSSLVSEIVQRPGRFENTVNSLYAAYSKFGPQSSSYPHHGQRVLNHLSTFVDESEGPILAVTNVLDPHDPYLNTPPSVQESRDRDELRAVEHAHERYNIDKQYLLTDDGMPEQIESVFDTWSELYDSQAEIYREYSCESDRLLKAWRDRNESVFDDSLVVIVGDHGQLFGEEGMVGHQTSLHPDGINVPLAISPPKTWESQAVERDGPVSISGVGASLKEVCKGDITSTRELINRIEEASRDHGDDVTVCVDGPKWYMKTLYKNEEFHRSLIDALAVRKVAHIGRDRVEIFESPWDSETIDSKVYEYAEGSRTVLEDENASLDEETKQWLSRGHNEESNGDLSVSSQLKALGYA